MAKAHGSDDETCAEYSDDSLPAFDNQNKAGAEDVSFDIDKITGNAYCQTAQAKIAEGRALRCPFPDLSSLINANESTEDPGTRPTEDSPTQKASCDYAFRRAYDLRRHLQTSHKFSAEKDIVELWVARQKLAWYS
jgi:hypothetical protein